MDSLVSGLARNILPALHEEGNRRAYLNNLFRVQMVAGDFAAAETSLSALRPLSKASDPVYPEFVI